MDRTSQEAAFVRETVGVRRRDELVLVEVSGDDRRSWLNGQLTQDVRTIPAGEARYALAVTVRGKIMADAWVFERGETLGVVLPREALTTVLASFDKQIIMEDVVLSVAEGAAIASMHGPRSELLCAALKTDPQRDCARFDELGSHGALLVLRESETAPASFAALVKSAEELGGGELRDAGFELARLRAGYPRFGADFGDQHYPQEAGLILRAVSFNKGCYLGQEVVCTLESRGRVSRQLVVLAREGVAHVLPATPLLDTSGQVVGQLTSVCADAEARRTLALGYAKAAASPDGAQLHAGAIELQVVRAVGTI